MEIIMSKHAFQFKFQKYFSYTHLIYANSKQEETDIFLQLFIKFFKTLLENEYIILSDRKTNSILPAYLSDIKIATNMISKEIKWIFEENMELIFMMFFHDDISFLTFFDNINNDIFNDNDSFNGNSLSLELYMYYIIKSTKTKQFPSNYTLFKEAFKLVKSFCEINDIDFNTRFFDYLNMRLDYDQDKHSFYLYNSMKDKTTMTNCRINTLHYKDVLDVFKNLDINVIYFLKTINNIETVYIILRYILENLTKQVYYVSMKVLKDTYLQNLSNNMLMQVLLKDHIKNILNIVMADFKLLPGFCYEIAWQLLPTVLYNFKPVFYKDYISNVSYDDLFDLIIKIVELINDENLISTVYKSYAYYIVSEDKPVSEIRHLDKVIPALLEIFITDSLVVNNYVRKHYKEFPINYIHMIGSTLL